MHLIAGLKKKNVTFNISSNPWPPPTSSRLEPRHTDPSEVDQRTPVMTAPLQQLRDARRMDSSTTLKPMTQQQDTLERETPRWLWLVSPAPRARSLCSSHSWTPQRVSPALSPSLCPPLTPPSTPPPCLFSCSSSPRCPLRAPPERTSRFTLELDIADARGSVCHWRRSTSAGKTYAHGLSCHK